MSGEDRVQLGVKLRQFASQWMKFVSDKCERGRGLRPRYLCLCTSSGTVAEWLACWTQAQKGPGSNRDAAG